MRLNPRTPRTNQVGPAFESLVGPPTSETTAQSCAELYCPIKTPPVSFDVPRQNPRSLEICSDVILKPKRLSLLLQQSSNGICLFNSLDTFEPLSRKYLLEYDKDWSL